MFPGMLTSGSQCAPPCMLAAALHSHALAPNSPAMQVLSVALPCSGRDESAGGRSWAIDGCSEANMDGWMDAARR